MGDLFDVGFSLVFSRLLSIRPKISKQGNTLVASSDWRSQLFSLGSFGRTVTVDPIQKVVRIRYKRFWFFSKSRRIEFQWINQVNYGYADLAPGSVMPIAAYQQDDLYTVGLRLYDGEDVALFRFHGEGAFVNNGIFPDWFYWEDQFVANLTQGNQERESLYFADLVSQMVGVPIGNPQL